MFTEFTLHKSCDSLALQMLFIEILSNRNLTYMALEHGTELSECLLSSLLHIGRAVTLPGDTVFCPESSVISLSRSSVQVVGNFLWTWAGLKCLGSFCMCVSDIWCNIVMMESCCRNEQNLSPYAQRKFDLLKTHEVPDNSF